MAMAKFVRRISQLEMVKGQTLRCCYSTMMQDRTSTPNEADIMSTGKCHFESSKMSQYSEKAAGAMSKQRIGVNVPKKDKVKFILNTVLDLKDDKESVYSALDAWVAWEQNFPMDQVKKAIEALEKEQQWHRVIQVIKWMLSKGQGTTRGTYGQLIRALDMDRRPEEAHEIWVKKLGRDLHSVPWQLCHLMISVYYRNDMLEKLVELFKSLEAYDRKPRDKLIVQKVADTYEILGRLEEKDRVMEKYKELFTKDSPQEKVKSPRRKSK